MLLREGGGAYFWHLFLDTVNPPLLPPEHQGILSRFVWEWHRADILKRHLPPSFCVVDVVRVFQWQKGEEGKIGSFAIKGAP